MLEKQPLPALPTACKFYALGKCKNGDKCRYVHSDFADISTEPVELPPVSSNGGDGFEERLKSPNSKDVTEARESEGLQEPSPLSEVPQIFVGASVTVNGICSSPGLNGPGEVTQFFKEKGRFAVGFQDGSTKLLKPCNLLFPASCPRCASEVTSNYCLDCPEDPPESECAHSTCMRCKRRLPWGYFMGMRGEDQESCFSAPRQCGSWKRP